MRGTRSPLPTGTKLSGHLPEEHAVPDQANHISSVCRAVSPLFFDEMAESIYRGSL
jgi:hypothetical protein